MFLNQRLIQSELRPRSHTNQYRMEQDGAEFIVMDDEIDFNPDGATMIRTIFLVTVLLTGCHKAADKPEQKIAEPSSVKLLWMDDISYPYSGTEFENAFVLEPECRGLIFRHWNGLSDEERMRAMKAPHWICTTTVATA